jgi:hypothetical protein
MKYPIVKIEYRDIMLYDCQQKKIDPMIIGIFSAVGFLIEDSKTRVILAREILTNQNDDLRGAMVIPKETIIKFTKIKQDG